jgi:hypothetical protein
MARTRKMIDVENRTVTFSYAAGGVRVYSLDELSKEMVIRLALHGLAQKGGDSYAGKDEAEHEECTETVWNNLLNDNWGATRGSGLEDKLAEAEERLDNYINLNDDQKRLMASMGVTRAAIEKEIRSIEKAIERRDKAAAEKK